MKQSSEVSANLTRLQESFREATGDNFKHFYCPILHRDEPTQLCMGHVINDAITGSCRVRVVQRKDVDGFYGAYFEADYTALLKVAVPDCNAVWPIGTLPS